MTLTYSLSEPDFYTFQLFTASKSKRIKNQIIKNWIIISLCFLTLSYTFYDLKMFSLTYYFLGCSVVGLIFYPFYLKWRYKKHYKKHVTETYSNRFGEVVNLEITDSHFESSTDSSESKISLTELEKITETENYYFIKLKSAATFIIPKIQLKNLTEVNTFLQNLCVRLKVEFAIELNWKWLNKISKYPFARHVSRVSRLSYKISLLTSSKILNAPFCVDDSAYKRKTGSVPLGRIIIHSSFPKKYLNPSRSSIRSTT